MKKSQVSLEFILAVGIVLVMFLVIFGFTINRNKEISESKIRLDKSNSCLLISSLLTSAFVNGVGTVITVDISHNLTINRTNNASYYKGIDVNGSYCLLSVNNVPNIKLRSGMVKIENQNGFVDIKNV